MPLRDQAAQEASLDNDYGPTRGPHSPASFEVAFFTDDPDFDGVELAGNGYARATHSNDAWDPAADFVKLSHPITFPDSTGEWETVRYVGLFDPVGGVWWDVVPLEEPLDVTGPGPGPVVTIPIFYDNALD